MREEEAVRAAGNVTRMGQLEVRELGSLELNCRMEPWVLSELQSLHVFWMGVAKI